MRPGLKGAIVNVSLLAGTLLVTCLLAEIALRIVKINTPSAIEFIEGKGLRRIPGAWYVHTKEGHSEGRFNEFGFRDRSRVERKPAGTYRIEVFGDSFVDALQVPLEESFPARLERSLGGAPTPVEVLNLGQSGFGTTDECLRFEHFGQPFAPDLVVVALFVGNDIRNNSKTLNTEALTYYYVLGPDGKLSLDTSLPDAYEKNRSLFQRAFQALKRHSYLASLVSERLYLLRRARTAEETRLKTGTGPAHAGGLAPLDDLNLFVDEPPQVWKDAWDVTLAVLLKFRADAERAGARFAVMMIPTAEQIDVEAQSRAEATAGRKLDWDRPDAILEPFAREHGIPFLRLTPIFRETYAKTREPLYGFGGGGNHGHWNANGHELAAASLRSFLESEGLLPRAAGDGAPR